MIDANAIYISIAICALYTLGLLVMNQWFRRD